MIEGRKDLYDRRRYLIIFGILFCLIYIRYCYFGFEYYYQLDDYIQYHNYVAFNDNLPELMQKTGMLKSRPLAGLADLYVWSNFFNIMPIAVGIISLMYAGAGVLLHKVFHHYFGTGILFFVIFALLPLNFEGAYWVSASSRVIVGIFFASLSLYFFDKWCREGKRQHLILYAATQFVSFCFYEQIVLFSGAATMIVMLQHVKKGNKRYLWGLWMFAAAALYFIIITLAPEGLHPARSGFFLPWNEGWTKSASNVLKQMQDVFFKCGGLGITKGVVRGFKILINQPNFWYIIGSSLLCVGFFFAVKTKDRVKGKFLPEFLAGLFLTIAPLLVFLVIKEPWFGARNALTSFCGIALMADALFDVVFGRMKKSEIIQRSLVTAFLPILLIASISEIHDYRKITEDDTRLCIAAYEAAGEFKTEKDERVWLLNVDPCYLDDANFFFHEHGMGVTSSDWAFTGALRAISEDGTAPYVRPVADGSAIWSSELDNFFGAPLFVFEGEKFVFAKIKELSGNEWKVETVDGRNLASLIEKDGNLWLYAQ